MIDMSLGDLAYNLAYHDFLGRVFAGPYPDLDEIYYWGA